jgi:hypothetical protein
LADRASFLETIKQMVFEADFAGIKEELKECDWTLGTRL